MKKSRHKFVVETPLGGLWHYYFGTESRAMAESILAHLTRSGREGRIVCA